MIGRLLKASVLPVLALAVLGSGIACVYVRHEARKLFVELQRLENERDRLEIEWGQLRLEQSTWATHARVENMARDELNMIEPDHSSIMAIKQPRKP